MFVIHHPILLFLLIAFGTAEADYVAINWNASMDRGNSREREYKYPMYQEVAPAPCDLTDACDVFCPQDSDCNEAQKLSFVSSKTDTRCDGPLSVFDCSCHKFEKPEWLSVFCYVYKNPIYLGKFFKTQQKIEKLSSLKNLILKKRHNLFKNRQNDGQVRAKMVNQYGSPIVTFIPTSESFPSVSPLLSKVPLKDFSHACKSKPISYGYATSTICLTKVTQKLCQNGYVLSILPYLVQAGNISTSSNIPVVMNDLRMLKGIKTEVIIKCVELKSKTKKFKNQDRSYYQEENVKPCDVSSDMHQTLLENNICKNVLVHVQQDFVLNGSDIVKLKVKYGLADVPVNDTDMFSDIISKYIFLKQRFSVSFFDILSKPSDRQNISKNDELLNRGYFVGEELNFGYKQFEQHSPLWSCFPK